jgi:4-oxalocrotonate tautomerase
MPLVTIKIFEGRTLEQKRNMVKAVTESLVKTIGCKSESVHIDIVDLKKENLANNGKLACD